MAEFKKFSPMRYTAATEEAAVAGALSIVGAAREFIDYEVLEKNAKGVTVRIRPRDGGSAPKAAPAPVVAPVASPVASTPVAADLAPVAEPEVEPAAESAFAAAIIEDEADVDDARDEASDLEAPVSRTSYASPASSARYSSSASSDSSTLIDEELLSIVREQAEEMLEKMGLTVAVILGDVENNVIPITVEGNDVGILIGKHGATLQSFQYLLNLTINNVDNLGGDPDGGVRVVVDAGNYRARRQSSLEATARQAASKARRDGRPIRLDPMPAHERRLIHMYLVSEPDISTQSEGREPMRRIVVIPANARPDAGRGGFRSAGPRPGGTYRSSGPSNGMGGSRPGGSRPGGYRGR